MSKAQREEAEFKRITAYCVAESFRMKLLASFLKREHNVLPRVFDEAMYVVSVHYCGRINHKHIFTLQRSQMYHLPLLPGYGPDTMVRSSAPAKPITGKSYLSRLTEAEENGYQGSYFNSPAPASPRDGYISSSLDHSQPLSPTTSTEPLTAYESDAAPALEPEPILISDFEPIFPSTGTEFTPEIPSPPPPPMPLRSRMPEERVAEVVFFEYGVVVFFGLEERQEIDILADIEKAQILKRRIAEDDWEVEEFHFIVCILLRHHALFCSETFPLARPTYCIPSHLQ